MYLTMVVLALTQAHNRKWIDLYINYARFHSKKFCYRTSSPITNICLSCIPSYQIFSHKYMGLSPPSHVFFFSWALTLLCYLVLKPHNKISKELSFICTITIRPVIESYLHHCTQSLSNTIFFFLHPPLSVQPWLWLALGELEGEVTPIKVEFPHWSYMLVT